MQYTTPPVTRPMESRLEPVASEMPAVSWGAVLAGAAVAAVLSLIMLVLGVGLGLSAVSPWSASGVSATTLGVSTILWISFTALVASGAGGYVAGRLRTRWAATHVDEVYFRDTAHGFLAWAVATLVSAGLLASAIGSVVATGAQVGGSALAAAGTAATASIGGAATAAAAQGGDSSSASSGVASPTAYFVDSLFRAPAAGSAGASAPVMGSGSPMAAGGSSPAATTAEAARIFARSLQSGTMSQDDTRYVAQLVAQRTGLSAPEAERRVTEVYGRAQQSLRDAEAKAREVADQARKATAYGSLWVFVSLLLGAFAASLLATFGGRQRDQQT